jgi:NADPH:quinone reductase-like Zn-dependent oxidoreductase
METMPGETYFRKGDVVAARFTVAPRDAIAEYGRVSSTVCDKVDTDKIKPEDAAVLASASPAVCVSEHIKANERVLIFGAGGGVGSHVCQLARKESGASYICGVSCTPGRLLEEPLKCDDAVDYTKEDILNSPKYQNEPFDAIIDLSASGIWLRLVENARKTNGSLPCIVKPASEGGRYITTTSDAPTFSASGMGTLLKLFLFQPLWRSIWYNKYNIFTRNRFPAFVTANGLPASRDIITCILALAKEGKVQAVMEGPYPMTTQGVQKAFESLHSRHPRGKVVVKISD